MSIFEPLSLCSGDWQLAERSATRPEYVPAVGESPVSGRLHPQIRLTLRIAQSLGEACGLHS